VDFQFGRNVVHPRERKLVGKGAMAGNIEASSNVFDLNFVHIEDFGEVRYYRLQFLFQ
jgi:hypothetical protein